MARHQDFDVVIMLVSACGNNYAVKHDRNALALLRSNATGPNLFYCCKQSFPPAAVKKSHTSFALMLKNSVAP